MPRPKDDELEQRLCGWPERMGDGSTEFVYHELRERVQEQIETFSRQESKTLTMFGLKSLVLGASGIFGSIEIAPNLLGVFTALALVAYVVAAVADALVYWPAGRSAGVDPSVYTGDDWAGLDAAAMRSAASRTLVRAYSGNARTIYQRGRLLVWAAAASGTAIAVTVGIEVVC